MAGAERNDGFEHPGAVCRACDDGGDVILDGTSGFYVCTFCGEVQENSSAVAQIASLDHNTRRSIYKRVHHLNERIRQWTGTEPEIPADLFALIQKEARKSQYERSYSRRTICKILESVRVPKDLQEKYRSQKFKRNPMRDLNRFKEKWVSIRSKLTGKPVAQPSAHLRYRIHDMYVELQPAFEQIRHTDQCDGSGGECHKRYGCRKNILFLNFVFRELIRRIGGEEELDKWKDVFYLCSPSKVRQLKPLWQKLVAQLGWDKQIVRTHNPKIESGKDAFIRLHRPTPRTFNLKRFKEDMVKKRGFARSKLGRKPRRIWA